MLQKVIKLKSIALKQTWIL